MSIEKKPTKTRTHAKIYLSKTPFGYKSQINDDTEQTLSNERLENECSQLKMFINKLYYDLKNVDYKMMVKFHYSLNVKECSKTNIEKLSCQKQNPFKIVDFVQINNKNNITISESENKTPRRFKEEKGIQVSLQLNNLENQLIVNANSNHAFENNNYNYNDFNKSQKIREKEQELENLLLKSKYEANMQTLEVKLNSLFKEEKKKCSKQDGNDIINALLDQKNFFEDQINILKNNNISLEKELRRVLQNYEESNIKLHLQFTLHQDEKTLLLEEINQLKDSSKKATVQFNEEKTTLVKHIEGLKDLLNHSKISELDIKKNIENLMQNEKMLKKNENIIPDIRKKESINGNIMDVQNNIDDLTTFNNKLNNENKKLKENEENLQNQIELYKKEEKQWVLKIEEIKNQINPLENQNFQLIHEREENKNKLLVLEEENNDVMKENEDCKKIIYSLKNQIDELNDHLKDLQKNNEDLKKKLISNDSDKIQENLKKEQYFQKLSKEKEDDKGLILRLEMQINELKSLNSIALNEKMKFKEKEEDFRKKEELYQNHINELLENKLQTIDIERSQETREKENNEKIIENLQTEINLLKNKNQSLILEIDNNNKNQAIVKMEEKDKNEKIILNLNNQINLLKNENQLLLAENNSNIQKQQINILEEKENHKKIIENLNIEIKVLKNDYQSLVLEKENNTKNNEIRLLEEKTNNKKTSENLNNEISLLKNINQSEKENTTTNQIINKNNLENEEIKKELLEVRTKLLELEGWNEVIVQNIERYEKSYENLLKKYQELHKNYRRQVIERK